MQEARRKPEGLITGHLKLLSIDVEFLSIKILKNFKDLSI